MGGRADEGGRQLTRTRDFFRVPLLCTYNKRLLTPLREVVISVVISAKS